MSASIQFAGRLARDPEVKDFSGKKVTKFSIPLTTKNKDGSEHTDWYQCSAWGMTGEFVAKYFAKGSWIMVSGVLRMRAYDDKKKGGAACAGDVSVDRASFVGAKVDRSDERGDGPTGKPQDSAAPVDDSEIPF